MCKSFTLIELLVVTAVIGIITAITAPYYRLGSNQLSLQRSAYQTAQSLRLAQEYAISAKKFQGIMPNGYGAYFDLARPEFYILFADLNGDQRYSGTGETVEEISLEAGITLVGLDPVQGSTLTVVFAPPDPQIFINSDPQLTLARISVAHRQDLTKTKTTCVNKVGLIDVDCSEEAPPPPPSFCSITDTFNDETKIASTTNLLVSGGQLKLVTTSDCPGLDPYVKLMLHANGTDGSTTFTDSSSGAKTGTANGNAQIEGNSGLFDGTGDWVSFADSADWNFGSGDFTIDFRVRWNGAPGATGIMGQSNGGGNNLKWGIYWNGTVPNVMTFHLSNPAASQYNINWAWTPSANTWYHLAIVRSGSNWYFFVNGTQTGGTQSQGVAVPDSSSDLRVGADGENWRLLNGWLDEVRISKGIARWTSNFTPSSCEFADPMLLAQPPVKDTYIRGSTPTTNYGSASEGVVVYGGDVHRTILEFDISSIPGGATLNAATLSLYINAIWNSAGQTLNTYKMTRTDWNENQATWNNYKSGSSWTTAGGDYVTSNPAGASSTVPSSANQWMSWNVLNITQNAYSSGNNVELLIRQSNESNYSGTHFNSKEVYGGDLTRRPKLAMRYNLAPPSGYAASINLLLSGQSVSSIDSFEYTASSIPSGTTLSAQFSRDGLVWKNSYGTTGGWDAMSAGSNSISLSSLNWSGPNFYYKVRFTSTGTDTAILDSVKVNYNELYSCGGTCTVGLAGEYGLPACQRCDGISTDPVNITAFFDNEGSNTCAGTCAAYCSSGSCINTNTGAGTCTIATNVRVASGGDGSCDSGTCVSGCSALGQGCSVGGDCCSGNCYLDADNDRYAPSSGQKTCRAISQLAGVDCDDSTANRYPGHGGYDYEDGVDNDCNSQIDDCGGTECVSGWRPAVVTPDCSANYCNCYCEQGGWCGAGYCADEAECAASCVYCGCAGGQICDDYACVNWR